MEDISWRLTVTAYIFIICSPLFVAIRVWALWYLETEERGRGKARIHPDSWWLIATMPFACAGMGLVIAGAQYGFGKHMSDLLQAPNGAQNVQISLIIFYVAEILYAIINGMTKIAILCFYMRTFSVHQTFRRVCKALLWFIVLYSAASAAIDTFRCVPIDLVWTGSVEEQERHCVGFAAYWYSRTAVNIATDVAIAVLPVPVVVRLQMSWRKRVKVSGMFLLGFFVVGVAIVRATTIQAAGIRNDPTWNATMFCVWSVIEDGIGFIIACLPPVPRALALTCPKTCWWMWEKERAERRKSIWSQNSMARLVQQPTYTLGSFKASGSIEDGEEVLVDGKLCV